MGRLLWLFTENDDPATFKLEIWTGDELRFTSEMFWLAVAPTATVPKLREVEDT
jgi:hypothetical protein